MGSVLCLPFSGLCISPPPWDKMSETPRKFVDFMSFGGEIKLLPRRFSVMLREPEQDDDDFIESVVPAKSTKELIDKKLAKLIEEGKKSQQKARKYKIKVKTGKKPPVLKEKKEEA